MNLGFTYDEKIFNSDNRDLILKAKELGLKSLELVPDRKIMSEDEFIELAAFANENNIRINFHVPNFLSDLYDPKSIKYRKDEVFNKYDDMFSIIKKILSVSEKQQEQLSISALNSDSFTKKQIDSVLVLHGEDFLLTEDKEYSRTKELLEHCLKRIDENDLNLKIAIETLRADSKNRIGENHEELLDLINSIDSKKYNTDKLGICLDICHDSMNRYPFKSMYSDNFLEKIIYLHAHGIDLSCNNAHISLVKSSVNFLDSILFLKENTDNLTLNLELLSDHIGDTYLSDLFFDLHILNSII